MANDRHRVVIVGGGFGGLNAAQGLAKADADVVVIDKTNHHLFQPLLYQVATGMLSEGLVAPALRAILKEQRNVRALLAEVTGLDLTNRLVNATAPDGQTLTIPYDTLIVAAGAGHAYFGHDEWAQFAPGMKTLEDARRLRSHVLGAFEMAELATDPAERAAWLTFVIVGAGPTGVELAGQVAELAHTVLPDSYRSVNTREAKVLLLDAMPAVLGPFPEKLQHYTRNVLERMGVEIRVSNAAVAMDDESITVKSPDGEERIPARTKIWAAGVQASPLGRMLGEATGAQVDRAGRVSVEPDCTLPGHPEVFAVGDMVSLNKLPGVAQPAIQEGKYVAKVIRARLEGRPAPAPFKYFDKGNMATIGRTHAVANLRGREMTGVIAALAWAFIHVLYLIGWGNRFGTLFRWVWSLFTKNRGQRLITVDEAQQELSLEELDRKWAEAQRKRAQEYRARLATGTGGSGASTAPTQAPESGVKASS